jgi:hypothetical protein
MMCQNQQFISSYGHILLQATSTNIALAGNTAIIHHPDYRLPSGACQSVSQSVGSDGPHRAGWQQPAVVMQSPWGRSCCQPSGAGGWQADMVTDMLPQNEPC